MQRSVLVTVVKDSAGNLSNIYGRKDLVALFNKGLTPVDSYKAIYEMSDENFAKYGKFKRKEEK